MAKRIIKQEVKNSRLLKSYGSWLYCTNCNKTVAYICYTTYQWIKVNFKCYCGSTGGLILKEESYEISEQKISSDELIMKGNRYCCPNDEDPILSINLKNIIDFEYEGACLKCSSHFYGEVKNNHIS